MFLESLYSLLRKHVSVIATALISKVEAFISLLELVSLYSQKVPLSLATRGIHPVHQAVMTMLAELLCILLSPRQNYITFFNPADLFHVVVMTGEVVVTSVLVLLSLDAKTAFSLHANAALQKVSESILQPQIQYFTFDIASFLVLIVQTVQLIFLSTVMLERCLILLFSIASAQRIQLSL